MSLYNLDVLHCQAPETIQYNCLGLEQIGKRIRSRLYAVLEDQDGLIRVYDLFGNEHDHIKYDAKIISKYLIPKIGAKIHDDKIHMPHHIDGIVQGDMDNGIPYEYQCIHDNLPTYISYDSYKRRGDINYLTKTIVFSYGIRSPRTGVDRFALDQIALGASYQYSGGMYDTSIKPNDVVDYIHDFPRERKDVCAKYSEIAQLYRLFYDSTGYDFVKVKSYFAMNKPDLIDCSNQANNLSSYFSELPF